MFPSLSTVNVATGCPLVRCSVPTTCIPVPALDLRRCYLLDDKLDSPTKARVADKPVSAAPCMSWRFMFGVTCHAVTGTY